MQIVFLNRFFYPDHSATSQMLTDLAFYLAGTGHKVAVITSRQRYDDPAADLPARETVRGVEVHRVRTPRFGRGHLAGRLLDYLGFYAAASVRLRLLAGPGDIVVAKTDPPLISIPAAWVARRRRAILVNWLQDLFPEVATALGVRGLGGAAGRLLQHARNWSLRQAVLNVAIGELMRERLLAQGVPAERVTVIPNWADGQAITPVRHDDNPLRARWGLEGKFVVGYSGNLGRAHEFETILGAAERLKDDPRIVFLFIGGGAQAESVHSAAATRGLTNVMFQPYQPREMLRYSLGAADVHLVVLRPELEGLIVPSKTYGCLAAGRPILYIGDRNGEIGRLVDRERLGSCCPLGDGDALADAISELASTGAAGAGIAARAAFEQDFAMPANCGRFDLVFRRLAAQA
jgi:colanic acid biosynthesis glycosyl transferase WcaI